MRQQPEWEEGDAIIAAAHHLPGRHATQEWAIATNKDKQNHVLPKQYQRHMEIFSEEVAC